MALSGFFPFESFKCIWQDCEDGLAIPGEEQLTNLLQESLPTNKTIEELKPIAADAVTNNFHRAQNLTISDDDDDTLVQKMETLNGWPSTEDVYEYLMESGYWFFVCMVVESAWNVCDEKFYLGELQTQDPFDPELPSMSDHEIQEREKARCRNDELKWEAQMYNMYPIF